MMFKKNIDPKWEDPKNEIGGSLSFQLDDPQNDQEIDGVWRELVFSIIGHSLPHAEHINGIRFLDRLKKHKHIKIEVWLDVGLAKHSGDPKTKDTNRNIKD